MSLESGSYTDEGWLHHSLFLFPFETILKICFLVSFFVLKFKKKFHYWSIVALLIQCYVGFCRRAKWISYMFTGSPRSLLLRHLRRWYRSARCSQLPCSVPGLVQPPLNCAVALGRGWGVCVVIASGFLVDRTASRLNPSGGWEKKSPPQWHRKMNSRTLLLGSPWQLQLPWVSL